MGQSREQSCNAGSKAAPANSWEALELERSCRGARLTLPGLYATGSLYVGPPWEGHDLGRGLQQRQFLGLTTKGVHSCPHPAAGDKFFTEEHAMPTSGVSQRGGVHMTVCGYCLSSDWKRRPHSVSVVPRVTRWPANTGWCCRAGAEELWCSQGVWKGDRRTILLSL